MKITIVRPSWGHTAYEIAANTFAKLAGDVAGDECVIVTDTAYKANPPESDLTVLIGSDAANNVTAELYLETLLEGFGIRYCTDDYCIRTAEVNGSKLLVLAGGRPRATIYAVYRYFERFLGCRWFWDGDRITRGALVTEGIDITESPRFDYRGIRYFAHRSLHRFQAEQWSFEDWAAEIDWMLKKRLNLFMLRIGMDDLFQKAFPHTVSYPDRDAPLPEAGDGYDDRTLFWSLEYRGQLRKKILDYAFARDLMHPEDCGTMTHWYSRTPYEFLEKKKPAILPQVTKVYSEPTGLVWDVRENENLKNYFRLTDTHVKEYGNGELFHTIGLGERKYSADPEKNKRMKLYVYRRIAAYLKEKYPNAPLLIASWDLWMHFTPEEVRALVAELDPAQSIILDYTSDTTRENNFTQWGVCGKFPWIFGVFSGYESESEIRGLYEHTNQRMMLAKNDPMCRGMILWPELAHGDPLILEYLARNAWERETLSIAEFTDQYCRDRYAQKDYAAMAAIWRDFMPIVMLSAWCVDNGYHYTGQNIFPSLLRRADFRESKKDSYAFGLGDRPKHKSLASQLLERLSQLVFTDEQMKRDLYDIARTILGRYIDAAILKTELLYLKGAAVEAIRKITDSAEKLMKLLAELLGTHADFSIYHSLEMLRQVTETNPNFEFTLKNNAASGYCRSFIYENAEYLYVPELKHLLGQVKKAVEQGTELDRVSIEEGFGKIRERYFAMPYAQMNKTKHCRPFSEVTAEAANVLADMEL